MAINIEGFKLLCVPTCKDLYSWLSEQMSSYYGNQNVIAKDGYLLCKGNLPVMLCAHLDTVHKMQPSEFVYDEVAGTMSSPQGIGGDDRCGVYAALSVIKAIGGEDGARKPFLFFSTDEEVGGSTTKKAAKDCILDIRGVGYLVELDRQDTDDSVYYQCGNDAFKKWIDSFGFKEAVGTRTDICTLCEEWDLAGVNLSVGYVRQHTLTETVTFADLEKTIARTISIVEASKQDVLFTYCKKKYVNKSYYDDGYCSPPAKKAIGKNVVKKLFTSGDRVEAYNDCIGFQYTDAKRDRVGTYVNVPSKKPFYVNITGDGEVCVILDGKPVWVNSDDIHISPIVYHPGK